MTAPRAEGTALERAMEALERLRDYFDQRADADAVGDPMRYQGNVEMHRLRDCDELLAALRSRDADIAKWRECADGLSDALQHSGECDVVLNFNLSPNSRHSPNCQKCAALARFDAMKKEAGHE